MGRTRKELSVAASNLSFYRCETETQKEKMTSSGSHHKFQEEWAQFVFSSLERMQQSLDYLKLADSGYWESYLSVMMSGC